MRITKLLRSPDDRAVLTQKKAGAPPGSLVYTGRREMEEVHLHLTEYDQQQFAVQHLKGEIPEGQLENDVDWYDIRGLHRIDLVEEIGERFGIHTLALEDLLDVQQRPKLEVYDGDVHFIIKAFAFDSATLNLSIEQVSVYLTKGVVVTFQEDAGDLFESIRKRLETSSGRIRSRGADYLAYALIDNLVDKYFTVLDKIEDELDRLENTILLNAETNTKARIHDLRLSLLALRKSISPVRELTNRFADCGSPLVTQDTQLYVRDLRDHVVQITDLVETYRDVTNGLYDLYVSEISFRMNRVMQTLTVVSTIFIPLSFLVGVYGMNWENMPELRTEYGYFVLWAFMLMLIVGMLTWFRRKGWI